MKRITTLLTAGILIAGLAACTAPSDTPSDGASPSAPAAVEGPFDAVETSYDGSVASIGSFTIQGRSCGFIDGDSCFYIRMTPTRDCEDGVTVDIPAVIDGTPVDNVSDVVMGAFAGQEITMKVSAKDAGATLDPTRAKWTCLSI